MKLNSVEGQVVLAIDSDGNLVDSMRSGAAPAPPRSEKRDMEATQAFLTQARELVVR